MDRLSCIKKIDKYITDEEVKSFIFDRQFGKEDFLTTIQQIYKSYSNILNLTFALIYAKYRKWKTENIDLKSENVEKYNSYMRITKTFSDLYKSKSLGFSVIEPTIIDAQLDICYDGILSEDMGMKKYFNRDSGNRFAYFVRCAELVRNSSRLIDMTEDISAKYDDLIELISLFPYLHDIQLIKEPLSPTEIGACYIFEEGQKYDFNGLSKVKIKIDGFSLDEELDTYFSLISVDAEYYFLQSVFFETANNTKEKNLIYLGYSLPGIEDVELHLDITGEENFVGNDGDIGLVGPKAIRTFVKELRLNAIGDEDNGNSLIRDLYAINYRYVKQLSMAIVDCLTEELGRRIKGVYQIKHPELFSDNSWDNIMVILLVKESATSLLQFLFINSTEFYENLLNSLQIRFGSDVFHIEEFKSSTKKEVDAAFGRWFEQYFGESQSLNGVVNDVVEEQRLVITAEMRALRLVAYLSELVSVDETGEASYKNKYPLSINSHIKMLEYLRESSDLPLQRKKERVHSIVLRTLKSLFVFYCGFFKYAKIKNDYKSYSQGVVMTNKQVDEFQTRANAEFRNEVRKQTKRLMTPQYDIEKVLREIEKLNDECIFAKTAEAKAKRKILKDNLGRSQLLDFSEVYQIKDFVNFESSDSALFDSQLNAILEVYKYLQKGKGTDKDLEGVYPYVGTFEYAHETRDGYKIAHFSIALSANKKEADIEIISEFQYSINGKYYCLPNKMCCNNDVKLWIEPTLIAAGDLEMVGDDD